MIYPPTLIAKGDRFQITVFDEDGAYWRYSIGVQRNKEDYLEMVDWKTGEILALSKKPCSSEVLGCLFKDFDILKKDILISVRENTYKAEWH